MSSPSTVNIQHAGQRVSSANPLPVTALPPTSATAGTAAAIAAVNAAPDRTKAYTYLDAGAADERLETVTVASATLGLSYTITYTYAGSAGNYRLAGEARS